MPDGKKPDPERQRLGSLGGLTSWSQTPDWDARMAHVRSNSPSDDDWYAKRLGFDTDPKKQTPEQRRRIKTEKPYFARLRESAAAAVKRQKAERLRALAERLEAEAAEAAGA